MSTNADEETRAAAWRDQQVRRVEYEAANQKRLAGSPAARERLEAQWAPLYQAIHQDETTTTDPEE